MKTRILLLGALVLPLAVGAQSGRAEIMILGTYHMANPGHDVHNLQADDVLAPKRQQEIAQLIEVLKRFQPTKIAIEAHVGSQRIGQQYADYLAGKYELTRNEDDQIGFRLAKELGHTTIYAVDEDGDFPYYRLLNYVKANGLKDKFDAAEARTAAQVKALSDLLQSHTVLEAMQHINADSTVAKNVGWYYEAVRFGDPYDYAGPDLVALWFQRNIRIYRNIVSLIASPNERILVIYGYGHLGWLRQDVANDPAVQLRKLGDFVRK